MFFDFSADAETLTTPLQSFAKAEEIKRLIAYVWCHATEQGKKVGKIKLPLRKDQKYRFAAAILRAASELPRATCKATAREAVARLANAIGNSVVGPEDDQGRRNPIVGAITAFHVADALLAKFGCQIQGNPSDAKRAFLIAVAMERESAILECFNRYWG
jgi:hypothetical protein